MTTNFEPPPGSLPGEPGAPGGPAEMLRLPPSPVAGLLRKALGRNQLTQPGVEGIFGADAPQDPELLGTAVGEYADQLSKIEGWDDAQQKAIADLRSGAIKPGEVMRGLEVSSNDPTAGFTDDEKKAVTELTKLFQDDPELSNPTELTTKDTVKKWIGKISTGAKVSLPFAGFGLLVAIAALAKAAKADGAMGSGQRAA